MMMMMMMTMNQRILPSFVVVFLLFLFVVIIRFDDVSAFTTSTTTRRTAATATATATATTLKSKFRSSRSSTTTTSALSLQKGEEKSEKEKSDSDDKNKNKNNNNNNNEIAAIPTAIAAPIVAPEIPDIETFRNEIRKWSRVRAQSQPRSQSQSQSRSSTSTSTQSEEAPNKAMNALRKMFQYYNPSTLSNSNNSKSSQYEEVGKRTNISNSDCFRQRRQTVDVIDCNQVINAWSNSYQKDAPQQAVAILKSMSTMYENNINNVNNKSNNSDSDSNSNSNYSCIRPDVFTYTSVINAFAKQKQRSGDYYYNDAMKIFKIQMNDYKNKNNLSAKPNLRTFNTMINLCSKSNRDDMPEIAERLLSAINDWYSRGDLDVGPNTVTYNSVINCWSKSRNRQDGEAPKRCLELLLTMISKYQDDPQTNRDARPDLITYNTIMNINAQQGDIKGATTVFNMMKKDYQSGKNNNAKPNIASYTILINAWSKSNTRDAPIEAESLLLEMIDLYSKGILNDSPDKIAYSSVINCWSKSGRIEGPKRAYDILKTMIIKYEDSVSTSTTEDEGRINNSNNNNNNNVRPDTITFSSVMNVYAKRGDIEGCNKVFDMMKKDYRRGNINAKSDVTTCNILIDAWSKSGNDKAPEEAGLLLMEMIDSNNKGGDTALNIKPDTVTYCGVINCWSKSNRKEAPQRAFDILKIIISKYKEAQAHAAQTGNSYTNSNIIKPNTIAYNSVMDAYARQGDVDGATKVFNIMKEQQEQEVKFRTTSGSSSSSSMSSGFNSNTNTNKNKNTNAKPDIKSYTILINAWSKKSNSNNKEDDNAPLEAEALLFEIIDLYEKGDIEEGPNTITYGSVINCWSKSNRSDAPKRALKILKTMISKYNSNKEDNINNGNKNNNAVIPNTIAYSTVMDAYAKRGDVDGASNVFTMMKNDFRSGNKNAKPNRVTYSTMIDAWSKCSNNSKLNAPIEAEAVLLEMINLYSKGDIEGPGTTTYTSLINCWSKSSRPDAPKRSLQILKTMISNASNNQYVRPDTMTYNSIIDAHARQGDIDGAIEVFKMMTKDKDDINNDNNTINSVKPDLFTYNILIDCWYKSGSDNAPAQVEKILQEIKDRCKKGYLSQGPDEITYNTVIKCLESYTGTEDRVSELKKEQERTITAF